MKRYVKVLAAGTLVGTQALPGYISSVSAQNSQLPPVTITGSSSGSSTGCYPNCTVPGAGYSNGGGASPAPTFPESEAYTKPVTLSPAPPPKPDPVKIARCDSDYKIAADRTTSAYSIALNACVTGRALQPSAYMDGWYASCVRAADDRKTMQQAADKSAREKCLANAGG
jgi:hypothetical protein